MLFIKTHLSEKPQVSGITISKFEVKNSKAMYFMGNSVLPSQRSDISPFCD